MFCKHCGKEIADDSTFCKYCGKSVIDDNDNDYGDNYDDDEWHGFSDEDEDAKDEKNEQTTANSAKSFFKKVAAVASAISKMSKGGKIFLIICLLLVISCISKACSAIRGDDQASYNSTNQPIETTVSMPEPTPTRSPEEIRAEYEQSKENLKQSWNELKESLGIGSGEETEEETKQEPEDAPFNPADYASAPAYEELARYPDSYKGSLYVFYGKVLQVSEGIFNTTIRLEINDDINQVIYCEVPKDLTESRRILEDDYVTMYGVYDGTTTYTTVLGTNMTVPKITVTQYTY